MSGEKTHFLNELPIWKLKMVAAEYKIDVSDCRNKRDFVERIASKRLTDEQIRAALEKAQKRREQETIVSKAEEEIRQIGREVEAIAERPAEPKDIPGDEEMELEKYIDQTLMSKPTFYETDSAVEQSYNRMIVGDYPEAIRANRNARMKCLETLSAFNVYSSALSIRAADMLLSKLADEKGGIDSNLKTALAAAKKAFISGPPRRREETLADLETLALKAQEAFLTHAVKQEEELMQLLSEYESFGTITHEPRKLLDVAMQARRALDLKQHRALLESASREAETAKERRAQEIAYGLKIAAAAAVEAKQMGADMAGAETDLTEARKAFDDGSFRKSLELYMAAERLADQAYGEQLKIHGEQETTKLATAGASVGASEKLLFEAASYGINVDEGLYYTGTARNALSRKDVVTAAKFARLAKEFVDLKLEEIDEKRIELGVAKRMGEAKCGKCGKKSLYAYPDGTGKCKGCGHSFQLSTPHAAQDDTAVQASESADVKVAASPKVEPASETAVAPTVVPQPEEQPLAGQASKKRMLRTLKRKTDEKA